VVVVGLVVIVGGGLLEVQEVRKPYVVILKERQSAAQLLWKENIHTFG
jgi:hypothetical protein